MDVNGHLRMVSNEELRSGMEGLLHPVEDIVDIPESRFRFFRAIDKAGNRRARQKRAAKFNVDWSEYQIYRSLKNGQI
jgi:hypothetical protein